MHHRMNRVCDRLRLLKQLKTPSSDLVRLPPCASSSRRPSCPSPPSPRSSWPAALSTGGYLKKYREKVKAERKEKQQQQVMIVHRNKSLVLSTIASARALADPDALTIDDSTTSTVTNDCPAELLSPVDYRKDDHGDQDNTVHCRRHAYHHQQQHLSRVGRDEASLEMEPGAPVDVQPWEDDPAVARVDDTAFVVCDADDDDEAAEANSNADTDASENNESVIDTMRVVSNRFGTLSSSKAHVSKSHVPASVATRT